MAHRAPTPTAKSWPFEAATFYEGRSDFRRVGSLDAYLLVDSGSARHQVITIFLPSTNYTGETGGVAVMTDEKWRDIDRRSGEDPRSGVNPRPVEEQRLVEERRSNPDWRSRLLRSQPKISPTEHFGRQALEAHSTEQKLDFLVQTMSQLVSSILEIERRIKSVQQNTAGRRS